MNNDFLVTNEKGIIHSKPYIACIFYMIYVMNTKIHWKQSLTIHFIIVTKDNLSNFDADVWYR